MNIWTTWGDVFNASLQSLWFGLIQFAPRLIVAVVLFVIGWVLGALLAKAFEQVFASLKVDRALSSIGLDNVFRKAGMNLNTGRFIGAVVKWFVVLVFLMPSLNLVGLNYIADFLRTDVLGFLPRVVVAALILIIATIVAEGVSKTVMASAKGMSLHSASMLAAVAKYSVWVFAFIIALGQLGVAEYYMSVLFTGIIAMISLGAGLAFGLGGKDHASRFLGKLSDEMHHHG
jgi:hypothetical protein